MYTTVHDLEPQGFVDLLRQRAINPSVRGHLDTAVTMCPVLRSG